MKPRKLKELLVFAVVHKAPELLPSGKKEQLEDALMKLNTEELETLEEFIGALVEQTKPASRRKKSDEVNEEEDVVLTA
jgi:hypothetical protein